MSELKWTGKQIISFLNIFQNYPCLWDVTSKKYLNKKLREVSFNQLLQDLEMAEIPASLVYLKKKIKSLRDTYRKEQNKVIKSKKSAADANDIYKPKLVWFSAAEVFWHGCATRKASCSNLNLQHRCCTPEKEMNLSHDAEHESDQQQSDSTKSKPTRKRSFSQISTPKRPKLDTKDQYDQFAKHIAFQMRELPLRSFILLQSKIQNLITEERLANLCVDDNDPLAQNSDISSPSSASNFNSESDNACSELSENTAQNMDFLDEQLRSISNNPTYTKL